MSFQTPPIDHFDEKEHRRQLAQSILLLYNGKINSTGTVTLTANDTTTTLTDARIGGDTIVILVPTTANAMTLSAYYQTYPNVTKGQAVLNHASDAAADQTHAYVLIG